jgi:hypothetical protein
MIADIADPRSAETFRCAVMTPTWSHSGSSSSSSRSRLARALGLERLAPYSNIATLPHDSIDDPKQSFIGHTWVLLRDSIYSFLEDEALTRGAAIAFYTVTSIGPVLFIVVAIPGLAFGQKAASGALSSELAGLVGQQSAEMLQSAIQSASGKTSGILATSVGIVLLFITASGVFTEMQQTLNVIWRAVPQRTTVSACCVPVHSVSAW